jgi:hypothetical protein
VSVNDDDRNRIVVTDQGTPLAVYKRSGPGEWCVLYYCDQTKPAPPLPTVERSDLERWLAEQLS